MKTGRGLTILVVLLAILILSHLTLAGRTASAIEIYKNGDNVVIIVPFAPGGGYDRACRLIAPYFQEELKKATGYDINVIVKNITGAGGVQGYSSMFRAEPNGKTVGMVGLAAAPFQQLLTKKFDLGKFTYIAQVNSDPAVVAVGKDLPINSFDDFIKRSQAKSVLIGTSGKGASEHLDALLTKALLEKHGKTLNMDFVHYTGSAPAFLGVVKGEAEAIVTSESSVYPFIKNGDLKAVAIYSQKRGELLTSVQTLSEQRVPGAEEMSETIGMVRIIVAPPGLPAEATQILRTSMLNALRSPDLMNKAKTAKLALNPDTGEGAERIAKKRLETAETYQKLILPAFK